MDSKLNNVQHFVDSIEKDIVERTVVKPIIVKEPVVISAPPAPPAYDSLRISEDSFGEISPPYAPSSPLVDIDFNVSPEVALTRKVAAAVENIVVPTALQSGIDLFDQKCFTESYAVFVQARAMEPKNPIVLDRMADALYGMQDFDGAVNLAEEAMAMDFSKERLQRHLHFYMESKGKL